MHYTPNIDLAFISVEHIMRDVNYGWLLRYLHANGASFFFILVYAHIGRGLYYGSFKEPRVMPWSVGVIILVLMMAIAFLGSHSQTCTVNYDTILLNSGLPITCSPRCKEILSRLDIKPFAVFEGLENINIKSTISKLLKPFSGVYAIINLETGKLYVGSAITGNLYTRFHKHLYGFSGSAVVANAVRKFGIANFAFVVIEVTKTQTTLLNYGNLISMENHYIKLLKPEYNIAPVAGGTMGYTHTDETKRKMRDSFTEKRREHIGSLNRGKSLSAEQREALRLIAKARPPMSDATRQLVSDNSTVAQLFEVITIESGHKTILRTINTVADYCSCSEKTVRRALNGSGVIRQKWTISRLGNAFKP